MKKITHRDRILNHLMTFKSITSWEAIKDYNCTRLSHYIWLLKKEGYQINSTTKTGKNKFGEPTHWTEYELKKEN